MFVYTSDFSSLTHYIIDRFAKNKGIAIDATLGNGHDTDFLSGKFNKVIAFDIQKVACDNYMDSCKDNVQVINDSHSKFKDYIDSKVNCIIYNLGFLPGGDKLITTLHQTTLESVKVGLELLESGGLMLISVYRGHSEGKNENEVLMEFLYNLPKKEYGVMKHEVVNRSKNSPILFVVEKNN